ncbi:Uncharacterised protein [Mycobacteroides abscessus subsp. bolletii]|uniref:hypothetical protein n=1 Tax=Mycobacteroides abscessus TaxID=36809 RepID=UPI0009A5AEDC|nr:hypothetical protein [Mycobacteroides abscessus]SKG75098.1 Uncharacterised protein [Mycobacteroides abscessus subsp. bolletii]SKH26006.1 Uncharacterised protein [Mycobacteroides abscessus subsp. bolletii]
MSSGNVDFLTPVRLMADESGWTEIFNSCGTFGRTLVLAKANRKFNIYFDHTGRITRSVKYCFDESIDVSRVYITGVLPTNGRTAGSQFVAADTGPAAVLALTMLAMNQDEGQRFDCA